MNDNLWEVVLVAVIVISCVTVLWLTGCAQTMGTQGEYMSDREIAHQYTLDRGGREF